METLAHLKKKKKYAFSGQLASSLRFPFNQVRLPNIIVVVTPSDPISTPAGAQTDIN